MNMLKAARAFTGRPKVAKIEGLYHGSYDFAEVSLRARPEDRDGDIPKSLPYSFGTPQSVLDEVIALPINEIETSLAILKQHANSLACIMVDLMPQTMSLNSPSQEYLEALVKFSREQDILVAVDEVISFRLGYSGAQREFGIEPDLTSLGKIIGGGFPVGAIAGRNDVMAVFDPGAEKAARLPHGGTFNGNPITMVAGKAAMSAINESGFETMNALGDRLRHQLADIFDELGLPGRVTGRGSLFAIRFHNRPGKYFPDIAMRPDEMDFVEAIRAYLISNGIWMGANPLGCISTATTQDHVDKLCEVLRAGIKANESLYPASSKTAA